MAAHRDVFVAGQALGDDDLGLGKVLPLQAAAAAAAADVVVESVNAAANHWAPLMYAPQKYVMPARCIPSVSPTSSPPTRLDASKVGHEREGAARRAAPLAHHLPAAHPRGSAQHGAEVAQQHTATAQARQAGRGRVSM